MTADAAADRVRRSAGELIRRAGDSALAALALQLDDHRRSAGAFAAVDVVGPLLVDALALALAGDADERLPLAEAAEALRVSPAWLRRASRAGSVPLAIERRSGSPCVRRRDVDAMTRPTKPGGTDPTVQKLSELLATALPAARAKAARRLMTTEETAATMQTTPLAIYRALAAGVFPVVPVRLGRALRFPEADVRAAHERTK